MSTAVKSTKTKEEYVRILIINSFSTLYADYRKAMSILSFPPIIPLLIICVSVFPSLFIIYLYSYIYSFLSKLDQAAVPGGGSYPLFSGGGGGAGGEDLQT